MAFELLLFDFTACLHYGAGCFCSSPLIEQSGRPCALIIKGRLDHKVCQSAHRGACHAHSRGQTCTCHSEVGCIVLCPRTLQRADRAQLMCAVRYCPPLAVVRAHHAHCSVQFDFSNCSAHVAQPLLKAAMPTICMSVCSTDCRPQCIVEHAALLPCHCHAEVTSTAWLHNNVTSSAWAHMSTAGRWSRTLGAGARPVHPAPRPTAAPAAPPCPRSRRTPRWGTAGPRCTT